RRHPQRQAAPVPAPHHVGSECHFPGGRRLAVPTPQPAMNTPVLPRRAALLALALLLPACKWRRAAEPAEPAVAVHYLAASDQTAYQQMQRLVLTRLLAEADARLNLVLHPADGNATRQAQQLRAAAREKPDFLLVDPLDAA